MRSAGLLPHALAGELRRALDRGARRRRVKPLVSKAIRRAHLYVGLALLPWVLLYGITALLFNHSDWLSSTRVERISAEELARARFLPHPARELAARRALDALRVQLGDAGSELRLVPGSARWMGALSLAGSSAATEARFSLDPEGRGGKLQSSPAEEAALRPDWTRAQRLEGWSSVEPDAHESATAAGRELARARGIELDELAVRREPALRFLVSDGGARWACDLGADGKLEVFPAAELGSWRERLLRLHVQHGDPGVGDGRSLWSLLVDLMGLAMIGWSLTGLVMWWTIRPTRRTGLVALAGGTGAMLVLAAAVLQALGLL